MSKLQIFVQDTAYCKAVITNLGPYIGGSKLCEVKGTRGRLLRILSMWMFCFN